MTGEASTLVRKHLPDVMKPLWTPTLAWIAAVVAAFLLALASPGGFSLLFDTELFSHGASTPR